MTSLPVPCTIPYSITPDTPNISPSCVILTKSNDTNSTGPTAYPSMATSFSTITTMRFTESNQSMNPTEVPCHPPISPPNTTMYIFLYINQIVFEVIIQAV